ncbi:cell wall-active antibiotics response protein [Bacillus hwajinpoensis]|uniref:Cell wall-active antibiotics response protein n=1 Tax=Guptibacillus hwajinpoensis TaxID=208199 RepID=A0A845F3N2_9BACL|nr:cell wall-active antibiotics response protein LiaF [Pseudalkalibacillus hwajinpoensis]MYL65296.1 cell wall-active antibiotics response protein [Pseudalkalibacillus hwajinpoensis]
MWKNLNSDTVKGLLIIGVILILLEVSLNGGLLFLLIVSGVLIYMGRKRLPQTSGKVFLGGGIFFFVTTVMNMVVVKFFLLVLLVYLGFQLYQSKQKPKKIRPVLEKPEHVKEGLVHQQPIFQNRWVGKQRTHEHVYEWNDVNIQAGFGETVIDLSYTVLPKGESIIMIRNIVGNIQVLVPYELEVSIQHSSMFGSATIFDHEEPGLFNKVLSYKTNGYEEASEKVKLVTSMFAGDLEVKRV